jgi:hypothetical protein
VWAKLGAYGAVSLANPDPRISVPGRCCDILVAALMERPSQTNGNEGNQTDIKCDSSEHPLHMGADFDRPATIRPTTTIAQAAMPCTPGSNLSDDGV